MQVSLAVWSVLLFQQVTEGSGTVVRRRRLRKNTIPDELKRSARTLDLGQINVNQDFNTEFVKSVLYGNSGKNVLKEEIVRPIFATRQGSIENQAFKKVNFVKNQYEIN